jgi:heterodisulfide reductase subunit A-like polyferredoxin
MAEVEIEVFASNLEEFHKEHGSSLKQLNGIEISEATVSNVEAVDDQSLELTVESNGKKTSKTFEMIVLITEPQLSNEVKRMSRDLGLSLNYASFLAEGEGSVLLTTDNETIKLAAKP